MPAKTYAVLTDSACDMPYDLQQKHAIDILNFNIVVDGQSYTEREDFDFDEYYEMLRNCQDIPATSQITHLRFYHKFCAYHDAGCKQLLYVSINATGSATHDAALLARQQFVEERPNSGMSIHIVDSHGYSMMYGWFVAKAAEKLAAGQPMEAVVSWLEDTFSRTEILLAAFSLRFMKKSGRISAAAAIAGEVLGIRPVITLIDGVSKVQKKIRGDKEVLPTLCRYAQEHREGDGEYLVGGTNAETMQALAALCEKEYGTPPVCTFKLGAAVSTNTGPDAIAVVYLGQKRPR